MDSVIAITTVIESCSVLALFVWECSRFFATKKERCRFFLFYYPPCSVEMKRMLSLA